MSPLPYAERIIPRVPLALRESDVEPDLDAPTNPELDSNEEDRIPGIRCPKCRRRPRRSDRWQCSCLHVWNTFETHGVCPACNFRWPWTECLRCYERSAHEEWYGD